MDEESYDDTDDFDEDEAPKPRKTLMNMIRRRTQHRPRHGSFNIGNFEIFLAILNNFSSLSLI